MRKLKCIFLFCTLMCLSVVCVKAQDAVETEVVSLYSKIAYIDSNNVLSVMPEYVTAKLKVEELNNKYKDEVKVMQNDYNKKYSDFIASQGEMAENIRLRRMQELYELERHLNDFMQVAQKDVESYEQELIKPLRKKLKDAIYDVGVANGFICVYDLANPSIVFVTPSGIDITAMVKSKLGIK